ncbi:hypothetical protein FJZ41_00415 [Candidatus Shapirobacteria bacterium]|nr:hypothetical protein [Candidatus Shapirobacteria bacterium]
MPGKEKSKEKIELSVGKTQATILLQGAYIQRLTLEGQDILFPDQVLKIGDQEKRRGGIPLLFPWAGALAGFPQHGFARNLPWKKLPVHRDILRKKALLELKSSKETLKIFPYRFRLNLKVEINDKELFYLLTVFNEDKNLMPMAPGLHPYFKIPQGLKSLRTNINDFEPRNYQLDQTLFFPLQPVEFFQPGLGKIRVVYGQGFKRSEAKLACWSDQPNYFCFEAWSSPLGGFLKKEEQMLVPPGKCQELTMTLNLSSSE